MIPIFTGSAMRTGLLWKIPPDAWSFKTFKSPYFAKAVQLWVSLIPLSWKDFKMMESRDLLVKSFIPFILQTSLSLSYLFHNSMSQEQGTRNKKEKRKKKTEQ